MYDPDREQDLQYLHQHRQAAKRAALHWLPPAILLERLRQVTEEGWTVERDAGYTKGELWAAARCYAAAWRYGGRGEVQPEVPNAWPWGAEWWKPRGPLHDLKRAGALLLAEIDRRVLASEPWSAVAEELREVVDWGRLRSVW